MIYMIAAVDKNGGIGKDNQLLCHISADLKRFKKLTMGHAMIMGRKTFESLPGILPGRHHLVLTHQTSYTVNSPQVTVIHCADDIPDAVHDDYFVIGGASVYQAYIDKADVLYLTEIDAVFPADTFFPVWDKNDWQEAEREYYEPNEQNPYAFSFVRYVRSKKQTV